MRRQLLLSTATLLGALSGYARGAYAAPNCSATGPTVTCTGGVFSDPEVIDNTGAPTESLEVTGTPAPFQVDTNTGDALTITGYGAVSFTDPFAASYLDSSGYAVSGSAALSITSNGDTTGTTVTLGSVTVETAGALTGYYFGIEARNNGSGALNITANGNVTGTYHMGAGIHAVNSAAGTSLEVTTGALTMVSGASGILATNSGQGSLSVRANGNVTGTEYYGIFASNSAAGTSLSVTTGADSTIRSNDPGIFASNSGKGSLSVTTAPPRCAKHRKRHHSHGDDRSGYDCHSQQWRH